MGLSSKKSEERGSLLTDSKPLVEGDLTASVSVQLGDDGLRKVLSLSRITSKTLSNSAHLSQDGIHLSTIQLAAAISVVGSEEDGELLNGGTLRNERQTSSKLLEVDLSTAVLIKRREQSLRNHQEYKHTC